MNIKRIGNQVFNTLLFNTDEALNKSEMVVSYVVVSLVANATVVSTRAVSSQAGSLVKKAGKKLVNSDFFQSPKARIKKNHLFPPHGASVQEEAAALDKTA